MEDPNAQSWNLVCEVTRGVDGWVLDSPEAVPEGCPDCSSTLYLELDYDEGLLASCGDPEDLPDTGGMLSDLLDPQGAYGGDFDRLAIMDIDVIDELDLDLMQSGGLRAEHLEEMASAYGLSATGVGYTEAAPWSMLVDSGEDDVLVPAAPGSIWYPFWLLGTAPDAPGDIYGFTWRSLDVPDN